MTPQPQPTQLYHALMKDFEEIERGEELQRAYKRGFEDGSRSRPHTPAAPDDIPEICCKCEDTPDVCGSTRRKCEDATLKVTIRNQTLGNVCNLCKTIDKCDSCPVESLRSTQSTEAQR